MAYTAPRTWIPGEVVTAALLNTHLRDNFKSVGDPWTAYTPTWNGSAATPAIGNGTLTGRFMQVGKLVRFHIDLVYGSTTTSGAAGNLWNWSLPVAVATSLTPPGVGVCFQGGVLTPRLAVCPTASTVALADMSSARVGFGVPTTWAAGHEVHINGSYEGV